MGVIPNKDTDGKLSVLFIGAHPDDADIQFGGTAIRYLEQGHTVNYISVTNGDAQQPCHVALLLNSPFA